MSFAKLITKYDAYLALKESKGIIAAQDVILGPTFKTMMERVANDLEKAALDKRHLIGIEIIVHAGEQGG